MAILIQCECRTKQSAKNKVCTQCSADLDKLKKQKRIKYWICYRLACGKQRFECVGRSYEDARAAEGKRLSQKREGRFFEMMPQSKITFKKLSEWYLERKPVKKLKSYIYSIPYYDSHNGKIIGVDMFFDRSARNTLRKLVKSSQLPLL